MEGLNIKGVPDGLKNTTIPFKYGDYHKFNQIISDKKVGIVKMEVSRNSLPDKNFLSYVRKKLKKKI